MTINEIEEYLKKKHASMDQNVFDEIELYRKNAKEVLDEIQANHCWCLATIFNIHKNFIAAYHAIKSGEYEASWNMFDYTETLLSNLSQNMDLGISNDKYNLLFISNIIKEYQKLYPYQYFFSRECIIKEERCSICGKIVSIRNPCGHQLGKLYMGEQCVYDVIEMEFKGISLVTDPFDKYAYVKINGKEYNYGMLEYLMPMLKNPYDQFWVETQKVKLAEYKNIGRNDSCPCGSGKKYKKCHLGIADEEMNHYIIHLSKSISMDRDIRFFSSWEE